MEREPFYIPGWMNTLGTYGNPSGLEIWNGGFDLNADLSGKAIVGHSVGAMFALANRAFRKSGKIILVNPLFPRRNPISWYLRLGLSHKTEGYNPGAVHAKGWRNEAKGIIRACRLLSLDPAKLLKKIDAEDVMVIRGKKDRWICDDEAVDFIRSFGIELIEVAGAGHNWSRLLKDEVDKLLKTRFLGNSSLHSSMDRANPS